MDLATIAWILSGWFLVSVAVSLAVGRMLQHGNLTDADLEQAAERQRVVRYLRAPKRAKPFSNSKRSTPARRSNVL